MWVFWIIWCWFKCIFLKVHFYRERVRGRERDFPSACSFCKWPQWPNWTDPKPGTWCFFWISKWVQYTGPSTWAIFCFPRHVSRELDRNGAAETSTDSQFCSWWLYLLHRNIWPSGVGLRILYALAHSNSVHIFLSHNSLHIYLFHSAEFSEQVLCPLIFLLILLTQYQ